MYDPLYSLAILKNFLQKAVESEAKCISEIISEDALFLRDVHAEWRTHYETNAEVRREALDAKDDALKRKLLET